MSNAFDKFEAEFEKALTSTASTGGSFPKIDVEGTWVVKVIEASYGSNQAGTGKRGMVKVEVVENLNGSEDRVTARCNLYLNEGKTDELSVKNLAPWRQTFINLIGKEKLLSDVADFDDLIQAIIAQSNKLLKRGTDIFVVLQTRKQGKTDDRGREQFYKNVFVHVPSQIDNTPAVEEDPFAEYLS